jgi:hypothetical protein
MEIFRPTREAMVPGKCNTTLIVFKTSAIIVAAKNMSESVSVDKYRSIPTTDG